MSTKILVTRTTLARPIMGGDVGDYVLQIDAGEVHEFTDVERGDDPDSDIFIVHIADRAYEIAGAYVQEITPLELAASRFAEAWMDVNTDFPIWVTDSDIANLNLPAGKCVRITVEITDIPPDDEIPF